MISRHLHSSGLRYSHLSVTRPVGSFPPGGSNPIRQRCWESEAEGPKSKHSRIRDHPGCQPFLSVGLKSFLLQSIFSASVPTIAPTAYLLHLRQIFASTRTHHARIQRTILILFLDLLDHGSQHLLFNCVPSMREPPTAIRLITALTLCGLYSRGWESVWWWARLGKRKSASVA